ncbi:hypothetical protein TNCV_2787181 [Trichonephila clavipes]|nr:hypothetical protein TNCV_2787181 [Trichonephila clavipes]
MLATPLDKLQKALQEKPRVLSTEEMFNEYLSVKPKKPLGRGRPQSSRWIRKMRPGLLRSSILFLDLAPSDFYLFLALKKNLAGRRFKSNAEVKQSVKRFLRM